MLDKDSIIENMISYQIACKPGHRPSEHLFTIKSLIAYYKLKRKGFLTSSINIHKFYDSEHLTDCLSVIYDASIRGKVYRMTYQMNKTNRIRVKTPVGLTTSAQIGPNLAQGSGEAGLISSASLDKGMSDVTLENEDCLVKYVDIPVPYTIYMDDANNIAENIYIVCTRKK